ncbi:MAG TPA: ammonium transporter [Burkholderiales bacterium]|jgi:Amt family ammonium transporter|nr:ammonium transporter [Burkholderiales bacterium]
MKKILSILGLGVALALGGTAILSAPAAFAQDKAPAADAKAAGAPKDAPAAAPAPAAAASDGAAAAAGAAAATPKLPDPNKGDTTFMYIATVLVILMTIPGLALFYGGLVRTKNMLSVLMQVFITFCLIAVLWVIYGYSLAFTSGNAFLGGFSKLFLGTVDPAGAGATFSKGVYIPEMVFVMFQLTFAAITPALIIGSFAERMKFSAVLWFMALWFTFSYLPMAHMVWFWDGPDAIKDDATLQAVTANGGWLWAKGALDFAGGTVVHVNAGIAGLVSAYVLGKRVGFGKEAMTPHSLTMSMIGACLLWVGWYGFNVGSNLEANGTAMMAFVNTTVATAMAALSWLFFENIVKGKPSMLGAISGAVAGLVAITPACGFVGVKGALVIGLVVGPLCLWGVTGLKKMLGADDALDVFGVHGLGGMWGAIATGIFADPALGGAGIFDYVKNAVSPDYSIGSQVWIQCQAVLTALILSGVVAFVALKLIDLVIGLRVPEEEEREGLDVSSHGETAYHY